MGCAHSRHRQSTCVDGVSDGAPTDRLERGKSPRGTMAEVKPPASVNGLLPTDEAMAVLLVFASEDSQALCLRKAAEGIGLPCDLACSCESAMEKYIAGHHDLVIVDRRSDSSVRSPQRQSSCQLPTDPLIKSMRSVCQSEFTSYAAVTKATESSSFADLSRIGFDLKFQESTSIRACSDLLLSVQHNNYRLQQKLTALSAVFTALDGCSDAVELSNDKFQIQYINSAYERLHGHPSIELVGKNSFEVAKLDKTPDEIAALQQNLRKGRECESFSGVVARGSEPSQRPRRYHSRHFPVRGRRGKLQHVVTVTTPEQTPQLHQPRLPSRTEADIGCDSADAMKRSRSEMMGIIRKTSTQSMRSISSIPLDASLFGTLSRMAHLDYGSAKIGSQTLEAPIHRVINLINLAKENSSPSVTSALDRVLEILHQATDLYSGEMPASADDKITSDYVGGLMMSSKPTEKKRPGHLATRRNQPQRPSEILMEHINQLLENSVANMQSLSEIPEQFVTYLEGDDDWSFDIMELERVTGNRPLVYLGMRIMQRFNVCQFLECSEDTMLNWLQVMQDNYHASNCYHNATHGADVLQSSAFFLERDRVKAVLDEMDEASSLLGALVHDLDHPGRTNPYLINSQHRLALLYNDISVLESHHVSLAFQLTSGDDRINIFKNMARNDYKVLRQSIVDVVLATEMSRHFEHVGKFANQIVAPLVAKEGEDGAHKLTEQELLDILNKPENRTLIKRVLIKCSDISNQCRPLKLCKEWSRRISEEYFQQTDEEKAKGLPIVMPVFDRATCNLPQSQISFIDFFLREMFSVWHAFCDVPQLLDNMNNNYAYWKQIAEQSTRGDERDAEEAPS